MLPEVKRCADHQDIKGLRYIFADSLDVDPTFEKYKEDYEYCKEISGFFEPHKELSGFLADENQWNLQYWDQLKIDLMKNFSKSRFEHMRNVAKVVYADKIQRLIVERDRPRTSDKPAVPPAAYQKREKDSVKGPTEAELEEQRLAEIARKLEEDNRRIEAEQKAQRERIEAARKRASQQRQENAGGFESKKWLGIVLVLAAIAAAAIIIMALR